MVFKCAFRNSIIVITHLKDGHEYGFYVRGPGDVRLLSQRSPDPRKSNASELAAAARIAALEFSLEQVALA